MVAQLQVFLFQPERKEEVFAVVFPVGKPLQVRAGLTEKFKLHLFELAHAEDEISRRDFVSERFSYLTYAERHAEAGSSLYVFEIDENALRGLGAEVNGVYAVLGDPLKGLEHEVELSYRRKVAFPADGAVYFLFGDKVFKRLVVHAFDGNIQLMLFAVVLYEIVRAVPRLTAAAVHQRV